MRTLLLTVLSLCSAVNLPAQITATITAGGATTFCQGGSVLLSANPGADTYQWYSSGMPMSGAINSTFTATISGSYEVRVDSAGYVDTSAAVVVTVNYPPQQPGAISGNTSICDYSTQTYSITPIPGATSYTWAGAGPSWQQFSGTTTLPSRTGPAGSGGMTPATSLSVTANNTCGSSQQSILNINAYTTVYGTGFNNNPDISDLGTSICHGGGMPIPTDYFIGNLYGHWHPNGGYLSTNISYQWYRYGNLIPGATGQWLYDITRGGFYEVGVTNGGCTTMIPKPVHQYVPYPTIYPAGQLMICQASNASLNLDLDYDGYDGDGFDWKWYRNGYLIPGTENLYSYSPAIDGYYSVRIASGPMQTYQDCDVMSDSVYVTMSTNTAIPVVITQNGNDLTATPGFASYQWYMNNAPIAGATNDIYTFTTWGDYFVLATEGNGCISQSNIVLDVNNVSARNDGVMVYPNPANSILNITANLSVGDKTVTMTITDISGRIVQSKEIDVKNGILVEQFQLDNIIPGMYFLKLQSGGFNKVVSFVKQ